MRIRAKMAPKQCLKQRYLNIPRRHDKNQWLTIIRINSISK